MSGGAWAARRQGEPAPGLLHNIGGPPREDGYTPRIYASGPHAARLAATDKRALNA
jgi:hypothetical protein